MPWRALSAQQQRLGDRRAKGRGTKKVWYGARRFFDWLETRAYKMHIRVLLSKYRSYTAVPGLPRRAPQARRAAVARRARVARRTLHELMLLPLDDCRAAFEALRLPGAAR